MGKGSRSGLGLEKVTANIFLTCNLSASICSNPASYKTSSSWKSWSRSSAYVGFREKAPTLTSRPFPAWHSLDSNCPASSIAHFRCSHLHRHPRQTHLCRYLVIKYPETTKSTKYKVFVWYFAGGGGGSRQTLFQRCD